MKKSKLPTVVAVVANISYGDKDGRTIWHRTIWHQDNLAPDNLAPDNLAPGQFGTGQFGTKIIKTVNLTPGQFGTNIIKRKIWHQEKKLNPNNSVTIFFPLYIFKK